MMKSPLKPSPLIIRRVVLSLLLFICIGSLHGNALAADMPSVVRLNSISDRVGQPSAVAVDRDGRLYLTHPDAGIVEVLSQSGKHINVLKGLAEPISIAVAPDGDIYIGNRKKGNVEVYGPDFQLKRKLGSGDGEFGDPHDVTFDPDGNIFVADRKKHVVRKYNGGGEYLSTLGSPGNGDGEFHCPLSVAVDAGNQELAVLDMKEVNNVFLFIYTDKMLNGARIQFFDLHTGSFKRGYDLFGTVLASDDLMRPSHLEVDAQSRLYVTDASFEEVKVYGNMGNFLGSLDDDAAPLNTPLGIALGATNRLYVVSHNANRLDVFGLDDFTHLKIDPLTAGFTVNYGILETSVQGLTISNDGMTDLAWTAESSAEWITLSAAGGFLEQSQSQILDVGVRPGGLTIGTYQGTVTISAGAVVKEVIDVTLRIVPNFSLSLRPNSLAFESNVGVTPSFQALTIENLGTGLLQWQAVVDGDWLSLSGTAGTAPSEVRVFVDVSSLGAGTYMGNIIVSVQGETNVVPQAIPVSLTLHEASPVEPPPEPPPPPSVWPGDAKMKWHVEYLLAGISLNSIWGSSGQDIFAVGDGGTIFHYDGTGWNAMYSGTAGTINGVWGSSRSDVFAVGGNGLILHYNGSGWQALDSGLPGSNLTSVWRNAATKAYSVGNNGSILGSPSSTPWEVMYFSRNIATLHGIWGSSDANIFAVGDKGTILHYDGATWTPMSSGTFHALYGIWGSSAANIFAVGDNGTLLHYDGTAWSAVSSGTTATLRGIWGNSPAEVYAVGVNGTVLRYDGATWIPAKTGTAELLNDVWSGKSNDIYAVSAEGSIIHGYAKGFPWLLLQPALDYPARQMMLREKQLLQSEK